MDGPLHRSGRRASYDKRPSVAAGRASACTVGWEAIAAALVREPARVTVVEAYPGVRRTDLERLARALGVDAVFWSEDALLSPDAIERLVAPDLGDDPVFGRLTALELADFFAAERLAQLRAAVDRATGRVLVAGAGAALVTTGDRLVYADLPRREAQLRQRRGESGNLGSGNAGAPPAALYKRSYFVDWRVADRHKRALWPRVAWFLDTTDAVRPRLIDAAAMEHGLAAAVRGPFRVVPFFDPAPWGGQWMKEVCDLPREVANFGWCFDCVPEENSLLLAFGAEAFEIPALDLVFRHPEALLGAANVARFGAEFPIRFDFLDTIGGGNLSVQVHPQPDYMRREFGLGYTQDESYYLLDAEEGAHVHLGLRRGVDRDALFAALQQSAAGGPPFPVERFVNRFPARRHDHFLIPPGTVHGSGAGCLVLEISATPYIFTFKLYDWDRPGLDGRPRPLHLERGRANVDVTRDTDVAQRELINRIEPLAQGDGWRSERTGLHPAEILETHRHWFTAPVPHPALGTVQVLNLVAGEAAVVESPTGRFAPFAVHYAETFIVPAAAGEFVVRPRGAAHDGVHATVKAFVRGSGIA